MDYLVPIGDIPRPLLQDLGTALAERFKTRFTLTRAMEMPSVAGGRYSSSAVLERLRAFALSRLFSAREEHVSAGKVLGVIDRDLYVPGRGMPGQDLNFVFGEAERPGIYALISLARLRTTFYGQPPDATLLFERTLKEAIHEMGHTRGLRHCPDKNCVMYFSRTIADTDRKGLSFCAECRENVTPANLLNAGIAAEARAW